MSDSYLPYFRPTMGEEEINAVIDAMRRGWLTTGPNTKAFEDAFAEAAGVKHAIALNSCTAALHLALAGLGVGPGDEVIMPSLTFVAGAQCARHLGATPVFCDIEADTLSASWATISKGISNKTKAIIPMHYAGRPSNIEEIVRSASQLGIPVVEDAAHAAGTLIGGRWPGATSTAAAYSFYATKNVTTAEGGMLVTNSDSLMEKVRVLALHGMDRDAWKRYSEGGKWQYDVVETGYKYNMPDIAAVIGLAQLKKLGALQRRREEIAQLYLDGLKPLSGITSASLPVAPPSRHSWCMFPVLVDSVVAGITRDMMIEELASRKIGTSVHYIPTHLFSAYQAATRTNLSVTESIWTKLLSLPLYPSMTDSDVERVVACLDEIVSQHKPRSMQVAN